MSAHTEALSQLRAALRREGYFRRPTFQIMAELALHCVIALAGVVMCVLAPDRWLQGVGLAVATVGSIGIGTNTHTSSHYATSETRWVNQALTFFGYPLCFGLSATHWWEKHVFRHHSGPNMKGIDGDSDLFPWFATTLDEVQQSSGWRRFYYAQVQGFVFPLAIGLTLVIQQTNGWSQLLRALRSAQLRRREHWIDLCALLTHVAICLVVPLVYFSAGNVIAFYFLRSAAASYAMFAVFAPAHMPAGAARLGKDPERLGLALAHAATTLNFRTGRVGALLCGGLQYQIEHHLLPDISHVYYPQVSKQVREFFRQHGLPYQSYGWGRAIWLSLLSIRSPQPVESLEHMESRRAIAGSTDRRRSPEK